MRRYVIDWGLLATTGILFWFVLHEFFGMGDVVSALLLSPLSVWLSVEVDGRLLLMKKKTKQ